VKKARPKNKLEPGSDSQNRAPEFTVLCERRRPDLGAAPSLLELLAPDGGAALNRS